MQRNWLRHIDTLAIAVMVLLAGFHWLNPGRIIASGDNFPAFAINPDKYLHEALHVLATQSAGVGSPDFQGVWLLPALAAKLLAMLRVPPHLIQWLFLCGIYWVVGYGISRLLRALRIGPAGRLVGVLFCMSNVFIALLFPSMVQTFTLGFVAWSGALWLRLLREPGRQRFAAFTCQSVFLSFIFMNPPMAGVWGIFIAFLTLYFFVVERQAVRPRLPVVFGAALAVLLLNSWWLYAFVLAYRDPTGGGNFAVGASWEWVMRRASIVNVVTLQSFWGLDERAAYPWAAFYDNPLVAFCLYLPFAFALLQGALRKRLRRSDKVLLAGLALFVFLAKGVHEPLGGVYRWLTAHVPLMWLFRGPNMQLGLIQVILTAVLAARFADTAWVRVRLAAEQVMPTWKRPLGMALIAMVAAGVVIGGLPLVTATVLRDDGRQLPGPRVAVPDHWLELNAYLQAQHASGRVLALPGDDYYQMRYGWGYYGVDTVPHAMLRQDPILVTLGGFGYLASGTDYQRITKDLWSTLMDSDRPIGAHLGALGVEYVLVRGDVPAQQLPGRTVPSPDQVNAALQKRAEVHYAAGFGPLSLYRVGSDQGVVEITSRALFVPDPVTALGTVDAGVALGKLAPSQQGAKPFRVSTPGLIAAHEHAAVAGDTVTSRLEIPPGASEELQVLQQSDSVLVYARWVPEGLEVVLRGADVTVGKMNLPGFAVRTTITMPVVPYGALIVQVGDHWLPVEAATLDKLTYLGGGMIRDRHVPVRIHVKQQGNGVGDGKFEKRAEGAVAVEPSYALGAVQPGEGGISVAMTGQGGKTVLAGMTPGRGVLFDANNASGLTMEQAGLRAEVADGTLSLWARTNAAGYTIPLMMARSQLYRLSFQYQADAGGTPGYCMQLGASECVRGELPRTAPGVWRDFSVVVGTPADLSAPALNLYAYPATGAEAHVQYRNLKIDQLPAGVSQVAMTNAAVLPANAAHGSVRRAAITQYAGVVESGVPAAVILKAEGGEHWQLITRDGVKAVPFSAYGYASGWLLPAGRHEFMLVYGPQRVYNCLLAVAGLLFAGLALVGWLFADLARVGSLFAGVATAGRERGAATADHH